MRSIAQFFSGEARIRNDMVSEKEVLERSLRNDAFSKWFVFAKGF